MTQVTKTDYAHPETLTDTQWLEEDRPLTNDIPSKGYGIFKKEQSIEVDNNVAFLNDIKSVGF